MGVDHVPSVSLFLLRGLFGVVERHGVPRAELLRVAEIDTSELYVSDARISRVRFERACESAIALTGDEALGLHWAAHLMPRSFGPILEGLSYASTLRHAFHLLARFEKFFTNAAGHQLVEDAGEVSVRIVRAIEGPLQVRRLMAEMGTAWFVKLIRSLCPDVELTRVDFGYAAPPYGEEYASVFAAPVRFTRPFTEIVLARRWLDAPSAYAEALTASAVRSATAARHPGCAERLHQLVVERVPQRIAMPEAARLLGLGERSLRRRLAAEGRTFKEIEFAALAEVAKDMLHVQQRTIQETAYDMGFSGPSAFHRAFKRWTGLAPSSFQAPSSAATHS